MRCCEDNVMTVDQPNIELGTAITCYRDQEFWGDRTTLRYYRVHERIHECPDCGHQEAILDYMKAELLEETSEERVGPFLHSY